MNGEGSLFDVPPAAFGRYNVLQQLSAGTTGPIFRGQDSETHAPVVIKVLRMNLPPKRAQEVAEGLSRLIEQMPTHLALAVPLASGLDENEPYLVSSFTPGDSLDVALRDYGPAVIEDLIPRLHLLAEALDVAARAGFVHGSLHPRDIVVSPEATRLGGVGVAPIIARAGAAIPRRKPYMAPEIAGGSDPSSAADQFALAALTYEWLFGRPITGPAESRVDVPAMPGVDADALSRAFTTALAPDPAARFGTCKSFAEAVSASLVGGVSPPETLLSPGEARFESIEPEPDDEPEVEPEIVRAAEPELPSAPAVVPAAPRWQSTMQTAKEPERFGGGVLVATLIVGLVVGFAAGYMARPRALQHPILARPIDQSPSPASPEKSAPAPAPSAAVPEKREAPAVVTPPGRLLVRSTPSGATVTVDGMPRGVTPLALRDLELGSRIVIVTEAGFVAKEQRVVLTKARPSRSLELRLTPTASAPPRAAMPPPPVPRQETAASAAKMGSLVVDSRPPGAAVTIDGRPSGVTPMTIDAISSGEHAVTIILKGYHPFAATVRVVAGERARAAASLSAQEQE